MSVDGAAASVCLDSAPIYWVGNAYVPESHFANPPASTRSAQLACLSCLCPFSAPFYVDNIGQAVWLYPRRIGANVAFEDRANDEVSWNDKGFNALDPSEPLKEENQQLKARYTAEGAPEDGGEGLQDASRLLTSKTEEMDKYTKQSFAIPDRCTECSRAIMRTHEQSATDPRHPSAPHPAANPAQVTAWKAKVRDIAEKDARTIAGLNSEVEKLRKAQGTDTNLWKEHSDRLMERLQAAETRAADLESQATKMKQTAKDSKGLKGPFLKYLLDFTRVFGCP
eukprot:gene3677-4100_t